MVRGTLLRVFACVLALGRIRGVFDWIISIYPRRLRPLLTKGAVLLWHKHNGGYSHCLFDRTSIDLD